MRRGMKWEGERRTARCTIAFAAASCCAVRIDAPPPIKRTPPNASSALNDCLGGTPFTHTLHCASSFRTLASELNRFSGVSGDGAPCGQSFFASVSAIVLLSRL
jgi:hypothetical protein